MSYMLAHLFNGWQVDQAILSEEDRIVVSFVDVFDLNRLFTAFTFPFQVIRFGHDWDPTCMKMDEVLYTIAEKVKNFAVIYLVSWMKLSIDGLVHDMFLPLFLQVDITAVPDFNKM